MPFSPPNVPSIYQRLDYVEFTGNVACTATSAATADTIVTSSSLTYGGVEVLLVEFFAITWTGSVTTQSSSVDIWRSTSDLGVAWQFRSAGAGLPEGSVLARRMLTAPAGTYSFSARGWSSAAETFTLIAGVGGAGVNLPGYIAIWRVA